MAFRDFYIDIAGNQNQLKDWAIDNVTSDPVSPVAGQIWFNITDTELRFYDGTSVVSVADLSDIAGGLRFKGSYDATADSPILDGDGGIKITVETGDLYVVSTAGTFYTETVEVGDTIIARNGTNASIADWIVIQTNIGAADETTAGYIRIATQVETDNGTDDTTAVTPLKLATYLANQDYVQGYHETGNTGFALTGAQTIIVTHNLNQRPVHVTVMNEADNEIIDVNVIYTSVNALELDKAGPGIASVSIAVSR